MIIYLVSLLPNQSIAITGTDEQPCNFRCCPNILHRVEFTAKICHHISEWALTSLFHPYQFLGGLFLLPFSLSCLSLTLSSTLALWCSDFPHHWRDHPVNFTSIIIPKNYLFVNRNVVCVILFYNKNCMRLYSRNIRPRYAKNFCNFWLWHR